MTVKHKASGPPTRPGAGQVAILFAIAILFGVGGFYLASFWKPGGLHLPTIAVVIHNGDISEAEAARIAKASLSEDALVVMPFRDRQTGKQAIVAVKKNEEEESWAVNEVYVLFEEKNGSYRTKHLRNPVCDEDAKQRNLLNLVGLLDLRGDGTLHVFTICSRMEPTLDDGSAETTLLLMDSRDEVTYMATQNASFYDRSQAVEIENVDEDQRFTAWFRKTIPAHDARTVFNAAPLTQEVQAWRAANPTPFDGQPLRLKTLPGNPPLPNLDDDPTIDTLKIYEVMGGPILVHDTVSNQHWVLFMPETASDYSFVVRASGPQRLVFTGTEISASDQLDPTGHRRLTAVFYDRQNGTLRKQKYEYTLAGPDRPAVPLHPVD